MKNPLKTLALIVTSMYLSLATADTLPMKPGSVFTPRVIENARDLMPLYPSSDLVTLPELSRDEEQKIVDLIQDKSRTYVAIKRNVAVSIDNWEFVGSKNSSDIWQLHIKSPDAIAMQAYFYEATLFSGLDVKVYAGEEGIASHTGEHKGNNLDTAESFWSTKVPGNTIVIEVWAPQNRSLAPDTFPFEIKYINHYFREGSEDAPILKYFSLGEPQQINPCPFENDLCDFEDGQNVWSDIAKLYYGGSTCTGSFLDNRKRDGQIFLLTAFHCIRGSSENLAKGTDINAQVETSLSSCASADYQLVGNDIRFIAGSEKADWALLWVNKETLARKDGLSRQANSPGLLGWSPARLATGSFMETLHHADGTEQNYAQFRVTGLVHAEGNAGTGDANFEGCRNPSGCTHYISEAVSGGVMGGASGASFWAPRYLVRAIHTARPKNTSCISYASRFDKMYEDSRVRCALDEGAAYYPNDTSTCDDSRSAGRPDYNNRPQSGDSEIFASDDGGGGSTGLWLIALLVLCLMGVPNVRHRIATKSNLILPKTLMALILLSLMPTAQSQHATGCTAYHEHEPSETSTPFPGGAGCSVSVSYIDKATGQGNPPQTPSQRGGRIDDLRDFARRWCEANRGFLPIDTIYVYTDGTRKADAHLYDENFRGYAITGSFPRRKPSMYIGRSRVGYVLAHEFGHAALKILDEYVDDQGGGCSPSSSDHGRVTIMTSSRFNRFSDPRDYRESKHTAHWRCYQESAWEVMVQPTSVDRLTQSYNSRYSRKRYYYFNEYVGERTTQERCRFFGIPVPFCFSTKTIPAGYYDDPNPTVPPVPLIDSDGDPNFQDETPSYSLFSSDNEYYAPVYVDDVLEKFCERQANNNLDIVWPLDEQSIVIIFDMTVADEEFLQRYRDAVNEVIDTLYYEDEGESKVKIAIVESDYEQNSGGFGISEGLISLNSQSNLDEIKSEIEDASEYDSIVDFSASLEEAQRIFDNDTADNKSVFIISDGLTDRFDNNDNFTPNRAPAEVPEVYYGTPHPISIGRVLVPAAVPDVHYFTSNHIPIHVIRVKDPDETVDDIRLHEEGKQVLREIIEPRPPLEEVDPETGLINPVFVKILPPGFHSFADGIKMGQTYVYDDDLDREVLTKVYDIEVSKIMLDILAGTNAYKKVPVMTVRIPPIVSTETRVVTISPLEGSAKFSLQWASPSPQGLHSFTLEQPDGVIINPDYAASMDGITYYEREVYPDEYDYPIHQYAVYNVKSPIPGEWKAHFAGDEDENFNFKVAVESMLQVDVAAGTEVTPYRPENNPKIKRAVAPQPTTLTSTVFPEPIPVLAHVEGVGTAVVNAEVDAEVTMPDGSTATLVLTDDGSGSDETADDGRYSGVLTDYSQDGTYHIKVTVKNDSGEAQFMELNEFATEPSTPTQVPKFQREGYTQVQVTGTDKTFGSQQDPEDIIPDGTLYWGMVKQSNPINWYGFIAIEGNQYFIQTSNLLGAGNTEMMTNVNLYEAGSALIDTSIGIPGDGVSSIEWTAPTSDYYLVSVAHANQGAGNYALSVSERDRMPQRSGGGGSMDYPLLLLLMLMLAFIVMKNIFFKEAN